MNFENSTSFLDDLQNFYSDNKNIENVVSFLLDSHDEHEINIRVKKAHTFFKTYTKGKKPKPELVITCLLQEDTIAINEEDFLQVFGKEAYLTSLELVSLYNEDNLVRFFKEQSEEMSQLCLSNASENLLNLIQNAEEFDDIDEGEYEYFIDSQVEFGFATQTKSDGCLELRENFEAYALYFIDPFNEPGKPHKSSLIIQ